MSQMTLNYAHPSCTHATYHKLLSILLLLYSVIYQPSRCFMVFSTHWLNLTTMPEMRYKIKKFIRNISHFNYCMFSPLSASWVKLSGIRQSKIIKLGTLGCIWCKMTYYDLTYLAYYIKTISGSCVGESSSRAWDQVYCQWPWHGLGKFTATHNKQIDNLLQKVLFIALAV